MVCLPRANAHGGGAAHGGGVVPGCRVPVEAVGDDPSGVQPAAPLGRSTPTSPPLRAPGGEVRAAHAVPHLSHRESAERFFEPL